MIRPLSRLVLLPVLLLAPLIFASCSLPGGQPARIIPSYPLQSWTRSVSDSPRFKAFEKKLDSEDRITAFEVLPDTETNTAAYPAKILLSNLQGIETQLGEAFPKAKIIVVNERKILSNERKFGMQHAGSRWIVPPAKLHEANAVLFYEPETGILRLVSLETNDLLWQGRVREYRIPANTAGETPPPTSAGPPVPTTPPPADKSTQATLPWDNISLTGGIGGEVTSSTLSGYGVTSSPKIVGAFAYEGQVLLTREFSDGLVIGLDPFYESNLATSLSMNIPVLSSHQIGENIFGGNLLVGWDVDNILFYGLAGMGKMTGTGNAQGLSGTGPHGGAGFIVPVTAHWGFYFQWDIQTTSWTTPAGSIVSAGTASALPAGVKDYLMTNDLTTGATFSFWGL